MTTFSKVNFKALNYNSFRPHYPASFYQILTSYVSKGKGLDQPIDFSVDLGCGTGVATYPLLNFSKKVVGLDLSPGMVETANSLVPSRTKELGIRDESRISFKTGAVEDFIYQEPREIQDGTVDLITAAQCIHWFKDYDSFFKSSAKLLKKGGTLAYFYYIDPVIVDFTGPSKLEKNDALNKAKEIYLRYAYDDPKLLGPHWEQPGRNILKHFLQETNKHIPRDLYEDVEINTFKPDFNGTKYATENDLDLKKTGITIDDFLQYFRTYSGYHNYKEVTGDNGEFFERFVKELEAELGWDRKETKIDLVWNSGYTFIRKK